MTRVRVYEVKFESYGQTVSVVAANAEAAIRTARTAAEGGRAPDSNPPASRWRTIEIESVTPIPGSSAVAIDRNLTEVPGLLR